ncbi:MAG: hypothetical protein GY913_11875 [Proteobacteria bacterium]|nr:hypothetical protein [Pseudomonadota bacterium]MCP4917613.1 hypothetical protein [Pseudomonadota bacterium]
MSPQVQGLLLSLAIEVPVVIALVKIAGWDKAEGGVDWRRLALVLPGVTLLTHPFAWTLNEDLMGWDPVARLAVIEVAVTVIEGIILAHWGRLGWRNGFAASLAANATSFLLGLLYFML